MENKIERDILPVGENGPYYPAGSPLDEVVSHFYHLDHAKDKEPVTHQLTPNLEMILAFSFGTPVEIVIPQASSNPLLVSRSAIIGPLRQLLQYKLHPGTDVVLINFKFNGFHRLFGDGIHEIKQIDKSEPEGIIADSPLLEDWWQELAGLPGTQERIARFTELMNAAMGANDDLTKGIISNHNFFYDPKLDPAKAFAESNGVSQRTIQMRFQHTVGYSVKELLRYLRFKAVVATLMNTKLKKPALMALVEAHNYHDQSHLNKDFKYFLGITPLQFYKQIKSGGICVMGDTYPKS